MAQPTPSPTNSPPPQTSNVSPLPTPSRPQGELNALLGKGSQFEGKLIFEGTVRIDGKFSGEIISRHRAVIAQRAWSRPLLVGTIALIAGVQGYAWWYDAGRAAGKPHTLEFWAHAGWIPPTGWLLWVLCAALGIAAMLAFAVTEGLAGVRVRASPPGFEAVDQSPARITRSPSRS